MVTDTGSASAASARPGLLLAFKVVAGIFAALILVQAFLAGRGWFVDFDLIDVHGTVGMVAWWVALVQAVLAFVVLGRAGLRSPLAWMAVALLVLTTVQLGLGMASEDSATAAWHIPSGVLLFGVATAFTATLFRLPARTNQAIGSA
jgi:hypothetical protein